MKNWEFYERELRTYGLHFAMEDNQMCSCAFVSCDRCMFSMSESCLCDATRVKWLYQEYKEPVVLTDDEKELCKLLGRGWIARDKNGDLYWYGIKPKEKSLSKWLSSSIKMNELMFIGMVFPQCKFDFIKWEDEEPWEVKVDD